MIINRIQLKSQFLGCDTHFTVLLPEPGQNENLKEYYKKPQCWRVLWLLHGSGDSEDSWINNTNIVRYLEGRNMMAVCPSALAGDYINYTSFSSGFNFQDFFFEELMPFIYATFPASKKREDNYIAGISMGGNGTLIYSSVRPECFSAAAVLSSTARRVEYLYPNRNMTTAEFLKVANDKERFPGPNGTGMRLKEVNAIAKYPTIGDYLDSDENSWDRFTDAVKAGKMIPFYLTYGEDDPNFARFHDFRDYCAKINAPGKFESYPGFKHEWAFWDMALVKALDFFDSL